jgi:hypothetical protein
MAEQQSSPGTDASAAAKPRKPYEKPQIVSEPIYETMALACGKVPGQSSQCNAAPFKS